MTESEIAKSDIASEITVGVNNEGRVQIAFGSAIAWLAMPPDKAFELARAIRQAARKAMLTRQRRRYR